MQRSRTQIEEEGKSIARELGLGVRYLDPQYYNDEFMFHLFHNDAVTGSSFEAKTLEEAKEVLSQMRKKFAQLRRFVEGRK